MHIFFLKKARLAQLICLKQRMNSSYCWRQTCKLHSDIPKGFSFSHRQYEASIFLAKTSLLLMTYWVNGKIYSIQTEGAIDGLCLQHQTFTTCINQAELQTLVRWRSFRWWSTPSTLMRLFSWSLDPSLKGDQRWKSVILPNLRNRSKPPLEAQTPVWDFHP